MSGGESAWRIGLATMAHVAVILAWHLFTTLGDVPKFVMPTPWDTLQALIQPEYRWWDNIVVTATEIYGGYLLAVVGGVLAALVFTWSRWLDAAFMPVLVSFNMIPKVALGPLFIVWF
ncbi:MAG: ABC transporter permease, partial [Alphaproteobacteria bacterium]